MSLRIACSWKNFVLYVVLNLTLSEFCVSEFAEKLRIIPIILAHGRNGIWLSGRVCVWHSIPNTRTTATTTVKFKWCLSVNLWIPVFKTVWLVLYSRVIASQCSAWDCKCMMHRIPLWGCSNIHYLPHLLTKWTQYWYILISVNGVYTLFLCHVCEEVLLFLLWSFCCLHWALSSLFPHGGQPNWWNKPQWENWDF